MKPFDPHAKSRKLRRFKPSRKRAGIFCVSVVFIDTALLLLAFFLLASPFVIQPGINMQLPSSPLSGGSSFGGMVVSITHNGDFYFDDEQVAESALESTFEKYAVDNSLSSLIIEADERVPYGKVVAVWNAALKANIREVSIATQIAAQLDEVP